jgi:hypothetical protein
MIINGETIDITTATQDQEAEKNAVMMNQKLKKNNRR